MPQFNFTINGIKEFEEAIKRNPQYTMNELRAFFARAIGLYRQTITQAPWRKGQNGGGVPVLHGNLKDSHQSNIAPLEASIAPERATQAPYATFVHEGTKRMKGRPWLQYAFDTRQKEVDLLADDLLKNLVTDLAK